MYSQVALHTLSEVSAIASSTSSSHVRLEQIGPALRRLAPHAAIHVAHRQGAEMSTIIANGFSDRLLERFESADWVSEARSVLASVDLGVSRRTPTLRQGDLGDPGTNRTVAEFLWPEGFVDGMTCILRSASGSVDGALNLGFEARNAATDEAREVVELLGTTIGNIVDEHALGELDHSIYLIEAGGRVRFQSGPASADVADRHNAVADQLQRLDHRSPAVAKFSVGPAALMLQLLPVRYYRGRNIEALVVVQAAHDLGLTSREEEVLRLVAAGLTNPEISIELDISRRTVASHIEHLLMRLGASNRAEAAARAAQTGVVRPA